MTDSTTPARTDENTRHAVVSRGRWQGGYTLLLDDDECADVPYGWAGGEEATERLKNRLEAPTDIVLGISRPTEAPPERIRNEGNRDQLDRWRNVSGRGRGAGRAGDEDGEKVHDVCAEARHL